MPKNWKAIALIAAFVLMQLGGRITSMLADAAVCAAIYFLLMHENSKALPPEE
ncbi:hypothetical protein [Klebsiella aerogenes]|uniref:hypothetical protein n=1 Tax=Klebsiella aerogenes TaxID=548 RepID=UPI001C23BBC0|nr:hypothetical protein [Klebsiella aerogenes]QXA73936.1 hypothetical protein I6L71_23430 [Klebsiella aerogenes]HCI6019555.1 hypothetical protein [Klebsiella quasipneumoniae subsp. quasipneumoniae]